MSNTLDVVEETGTTFLIGFVLLIFLVFCVLLYGFFALSSFCVHVCPVCLNCSFLIAPSIFSNMHVYQLITFPGQSVEENKGTPGEA